MNPPALRATTSHGNMVLLISNHLRGYFRGNNEPGISYLTTASNTTHVGIVVLKERLKHGFVVCASAYMCLSQPSHAQSPLPDSFNPGANGSVRSLAVQADGKIL